MFVKESDYSFCSVVGRTDVGCKRSVNEDSIGRADTPNGLAVVICDGMGGNVGGKTASETAVGAILQHLREHLYNNPQEAVSNAIQEANKAVLKKVSLRPELTGMGCTCVLLLIGKSGTVNIGHVGDSRIYLIRDGMANHLTKDQSYVQMLVDEGRLTPQEAEHHPRSNEITNAVGMMNMMPPVIRERAINPVAGDCFLLCSDGLSKLVPEEDIVKIVSARSFSTERRAEMLIDAAKNNGGSDNISVQLVEFSVTPAEVKLAKDKKRIVILSASLVFSIILFLLGILTFKGYDNDKKVEEEIAENTDKSSQSEDIKSNMDDITKTSSSMPKLPLAGSNDSVSAESETSKESPTAKSSVAKDVDGNDRQQQTGDEKSSDDINENQVDNKSYADDNGSSGNKHFAKSSLELHIERQTGKKVKFDKNAKLTKDCCEVSGKGKDFLEHQIEYEEDGTGGLIIRKKSQSEKLEWSTITITIKYYINGKGEMKSLNSDNIVITFE